MKPEARYEKALIHLAGDEVEAALPLLKSLYRAGGTLAEKSLMHILYALHKHGRELEAIEILEDACKKLPPNDKWPGYLASVYMKQGDVHKALFHADRAIAINPDNEAVFINRTCWLAARCENPLEAKALFEAWGRRFMDPFTQQATPYAALDLSRDRRLKVGYVSGDLKNHSVRYFIEPFLKHHRRDQVEVHAFMTMAEDEVTQFLKPMVDRWHDVKDLADDALFELIRREQIDILVDLSGHTEGQRLAVFARQAAPVQVTWFGFMQTLGMQAMDWRLTDGGISPPGTEDHFTEKLYRLECMVAYAPPVNCEALYPSPHHANGYVTMVSMSHTRRLGDQIVATWKEILLDNPRAGLIIVGNYKDPELSHASLAPRLQAAGLPMDRVAISPRLTLIEFMALASVADFALDSFPISGGTTTLHSIWMGLPLIALQDPQHGAMSGSSAATLRGLQLDECVADSLEHYKAIARQWISDPSKIDAVRERCRPAIQNCVLMDYPARVAELESAYRFMWHAYLDAP